MHAHAFRQAKIALVQPHPFIWALAKERFECGVNGDSGINRRVCTLPIGTKPDHFRHGLIVRHIAPTHADKFGFSFAIAGGHGSGNAAENVNRRVAATLCDCAVQHDMAIENTADGVGNGLVVIVAIYQDGEQAGDCALLWASTGASAF